MRKLATVAHITAIRPIPDADAIELVTVRGWQVVVKKSEFRVGDPCVYFEIDSMLDVGDPRLEFLAKRGVRTDSSGVSGHVLKTAKLRGQISQGLVLPVSVFREIKSTEPGQDVTDLLRVRKWEPPVPAEIEGDVRGVRLSWIPATDEERIQNFVELLADNPEGWVATEKIDGTSTTFWIDGGDYGVCSRNYDLKRSETNTLWRQAISLDVFAKMLKSFPGERVALQGETFGEGIQGNPLKMKGHHFRAFTLRVGQYEVPRKDWPAWLHEIAVGEYGFPFPTSLDAALQHADAAESLVSPGRKAEGIVWRHRSKVLMPLSSGQWVRASFEVISNNYAMKYDR